MTSKHIDPFSAASLFRTLVVVLPIPLIVACGMRSPLEDGTQTVDVSRVPDAGVQRPTDSGQEMPVDAEQETPSTPGAAGATAKATSVSAGVVDLFAYVPQSSSSPAGICLGCIKTNCGSAINGCINNSRCLAGITCAVVQCSAGVTGSLSGSTVSSSATDFMCLVNCFSGDIKAAAQVASAAACLTLTCNTSCTSLGVANSAAGANPPSGANPGNIDAGRIQSLLGLAGSGPSSLEGLALGLLSGNGGTGNALRSGAAGSPSLGTAEMGNLVLDQLISQLPPLTTGGLDLPTVGAAGVGNFSLGNAINRLASGTAGAATTWTRNSRSDSGSGAGRTGRLP